MKVRWYQAAVTGRLLHWPSVRLSFRPLFLDHDVRVLYLSDLWITEMCLRSSFTAVGSETTFRLVLVKVGCKLKFLEGNGQFLMHTRSGKRCWPILAEQKRYHGRETGNTCSEWKWQITARQIRNKDQRIVYDFRFIVSFVRIKQCNILKNVRWKEFFSYWEFYIVKYMVNKWYSLSSKGIWFVFLV